MNKKTQLINAVANVLGRQAEDIEIYINTTGSPDMEDLETSIKTGNAPMMWTKIVKQNKKKKGL